MSPLVQPPNRGYADWQRIDNYDSGLLWSETSPGDNVSIRSPTLDVSRYAYLGGTISESLSECVVTMGWCEDSAFTVVVGRRQFILSHLIGNQGGIRIPNLGPFLRLTILNIGGANFIFNANLIGTNRVHPLEFIPSAAWLINQQNAALGASSSVVNAPDDYYAGPVQIALFCPEPVQPGIAAVDGAGVQDLVWSVNSTTAGQWFTTTVVVPAGTWLFSIENLSAVATTYDLFVTQSITGAT